MQDDHVTNICSFLAQNQDVVSVNLSHNEITDVGMKILANFLEVIFWHISDEFCTI